MAAIHGIRSNRLKQLIRVLGGAFKKNLLEYIRYPVNMVFSFIMPVVWVLPYYFLLRSFAPEGISTSLESWVGSSDFLSYYMIGFLVSQVITTVFWRQYGYARYQKRYTYSGNRCSLWSGLSTR